MMKTSLGIAYFDRKEIQVGRKLGSGGFCDVFEINTIRVNEDLASVEELSSFQQQGRAMVAESTTGPYASSYAVKFLKPTLARRPKRAQVALQDLENEAQVLSSLDHPNIISIKGSSLADSDFSQDSIYQHFLIMDRLDETLNERIAKWETEEARLRKGFIAKLGLRKGRKKQLFLERLEVATEIASALEYLHKKKRVIHRDIKSSNIGFDASTGRAILFDFGIARSLPDVSSKVDDTYQMSGNCGTFSYTAPEVLNRLPYNETADVYSFAHLLWRILKLEIPYEGFSKKIHQRFVMEGGLRLPIDGKWPCEIQDLLKRSWSSDISERPYMTEVVAVLKEAIAVLVGVERMVSSKHSVSIALLPESIHSLRALTREDSATDDTVCTSDSETHC